MGINKSLMQAPGPVDVNCNHEDTLTSYYHPQIAGDANTIRHE